MTVIPESFDVERVLFFISLWDLIFIWWAFSVLLCSFYDEDAVSSKYMLNHEKILPIISPFAPGEQVRKKKSF